MANKELKMNLPSADDLFEGVAGKDMFSIERAIPIPINKLFDFPNHPFRVQNDEEMQKMVETIKENGILQPLIVRQKEDGNYEIISGHRRKKASEIANLKELPCIVRQLTDDEAIIEMVDSNMQRTKILPSEKAFAYKMKLEARKRQGQRNDLTSVQNEQKLENKTTREKVADELGESASAIQRYIRLTELIPELLQLVDDEVIAFTPAVDLSYLKEDVVHNIYLRDEKTPNVSQAKYLKASSQENTLTVEKIEEVLEQEKANQIEKFKLNKDRLLDVLPKNIGTEKEVEDFVIMCIKEHNDNEREKAKVKKSREYVR